MTSGRPNINVRAFDLDFPDSQTRTLVSFENTVSLLDAALHSDERLKFRFVGGLCRQKPHHSLRRQRAVAKANFRLVASFHIDIPLKPLLFFVR